MLLQKCFVITAKEERNRDVYFGIDERSGYPYPMYDFSIDKTKLFDSEKQAKTIAELAYKFCPNIQDINVTDGWMDKKRGWRKYKYFNINRGSIQIKEVSLNTVD